MGTTYANILIASIVGMVLTVLVVHSMPTTGPIRVVKSMPTTTETPDDRSSMERLKERVDRDRTIRIKSLETEILTRIRPDLLNSQTRQTVSNPVDNYQENRIDPGPPPEEFDLEQIDLGKLHDGESGFISSQTIYPNCLIPERVLSSLANNIFIKQYHYLYFNVSKFTKKPNAKYDFNKGTLTLYRHSLIERNLDNNSDNLSVGVFFINPSRPGYRISAIDSKFFNTSAEHSVEFDIASALRVWHKRPRKNFGMYVLITDINGENVQFQTIFKGMDCSRDSNIQPIPNLLHSTITRKLLGSIHKKLNILAGPTDMIEFLEASINREHYPTLDFIVKTTYVEEIDDELECNLMGLTSETSVNVPIPFEGYHYKIQPDLSTPTTSTMTTLIQAENESETLGDDYSGGNEEYDDFTITKRLSGENSTENSGEEPSNSSGDSIVLNGNANGQSEDLQDLPVDHLPAIVSGNNITEEPTNSSGDSVVLNVNRQSEDHPQDLPVDHLPTLVSGDNITEEPANNGGSVVLNVNAHGQSEDPQDLPVDHLPAIVSGNNFTEEPANNGGSVVLNVHGQSDDAQDFPVDHPPRFVSGDNITEEPTNNEGSVVLNANRQSDDTQDLPVDHPHTIVSWDNITEEPTNSSGDSVAINVNGTGQSEDHPQDFPVDHPPTLVSGDTITDEPTNTGGSVVLIGNGQPEDRQDFPVDHPTRVVSEDNFTDNNDEEPRNTGGSVVLDAYVNRQSEDPLEMPVDHPPRVVSEDNITDNNVEEPLNSGGSVVLDVYNNRQPEDPLEMPVDHPTRVVSEDSFTDNYVEEPHNSGGSVVLDVHNNRQSEDPLEMPVDHLPQEGSGDNSTDSSLEEPRNSGGSAAVGVHGNQQSERMPVVQPTIAVPGDISTDTALEEQGDNAPEVVMNSSEFIQMMIELLTRV